MLKTLNPKQRYRFRLVIPSYPAFNIYTRIAKGTTALGPVSVASVVNKINLWDAEVIDENNLRWYGPKADNGGADHLFLQEQRPADVVGLYGGLTSTIPRLYELARFYKDKGAVTIAGGQHFCKETVPEALSSGVDYVVVGEGEETIRELVEALEGKRDKATVRGIAYSEDNRVVYTAERGPITDFDALPLPDFSLARYAKIKLYPVGRIRGCGMDCEFCTVKGKARYASSERLLENIRFLLETRNARHFFIVDDLFGQQRDETIRFCLMLKDYQKRVGIRLEIGVQIRLDKAKDETLLAAMRQANIKNVAIGIESPIEEELNMMRKRLMPKDMLSFVKKFRKYGFLVHGMFIFGYPLKEGLNVSMPIKERINRFRNFIKKAKFDTVQVLLPVPLPDTELRERLKRQKRIYPLEDIGWQYYDGSFPLFKPDDPVSPEEMQMAAKKIMSKFYQFKYLFMIIANVFAFTSILFFLHDIGAGWEKWYRRWRNHLIRFGGWLTIKTWTAQLKNGDFARSLKKAKEDLKTAQI